MTLFMLCIQMALVSAPDVLAPSTHELSPLGETYTHMAHLDGETFRTMPHPCITSNYQPYTVGTE